MGHRRSVYVLLVLASACLVPATARATSAPGWMASHSEADQQAIVNYVYENAPQGATPYSGAPATAGRDMATAVRAAGEAGAPETATLAGEQFTLLQEAGGLLPEVGASVPALYAGAAAAGAFAAGWQIGTGIRSILISLVTPDASAQSGDFTYDHIYWVPRDENIYYGARVEQTPGAYLFVGSQAGGNPFVPVRWFEPPCGFSGFSAPPGARLQRAVASTAQCVIPGTFPEQQAEILVDYPYLLQGDLTTHRPLRVYDPQRDPPPNVITPAPPDPGVATTRPRIGSALDADGQDLQRAELDYLLDRDQDPSEEPIEVGIGGTERNDWCRLAVPTPDPNTTTSPWTVKQSFTRLDKSGTVKTVALLWGEVLLPIPNNRKYAGFGYRKIAARHGWTTADVAATQSALASAPVEVVPAGATTQERQVYSGPEYIAGPGAPPNSHCRRTVVVETPKRASEPKARGIITSYGRFVG